MFSIWLYAACFSIAVFVANSIGVRPWALHPALPVHMRNSLVMTRFGDALLLQQPYQQSLCTLCVATDLYDFVENVALLVDGAPPDARYPFKKVFGATVSHMLGQQAQWKPKMGDDLRRKALVLVARPTFEVLILSKMGGKRPFSFIHPPGVTVDDRGALLGLSLRDRRSER